MRTKEELSKLKDIDVYSLILFAMYKMRNVDEYSPLSELVYILDKDNLLKLCEYFGGVTIRVPTIDELENMVYSLVLYQWVNIDGVEYEDAIERIGHKSSDLRAVKTNYTNMCKILNNYDISPR